MTFAEVAIYTAAVLAAMCIAIVVGAAIYSYFEEKARQAAEREWGACEDITRFVIGEGVDLSGANLWTADLRGANLYHRDSH